MHNDEIGNKMMKYAIDEINMAEKYIRVAKELNDAGVSMKFQEIAKDELRHYDYIINYLNTYLSKKESGNEIKGKLLENVYHDWIQSVKGQVENFKAN